MRVEVNGQSREVPAGTTVLGLLEGLGARSMGTVVERNGQIVAREEFAGTVLSEGDRVEVVRLVGGG